MTLLFAKFRLQENTTTMVRKLVKGEKKIFGVCSGLANYFDIDPTIMRLLFVVAFLGFGAGLLIYVVMAVIMPDK
jgi:phage shock protein C